MTFCKICDKETDQFKVKATLSDYNPPKRVGIDLRYKTNLEVCPECGFVKVLGADLPFVQMLGNGYEPVTIEDIHDIDTEQILNEMEEPFIHSTEVKIWVEKEVFDNSPGQIDDLSGGITFDEDNYYRLVHFLLLAPEDRQLISGSCKCPVLKFDFGSDGEVISLFRDGRRRYSILNYLGVKRIPVAVTESDLELVSSLGFPFYSERE